VLTTDDKYGILEGNQMNYYIEKHDMEIILEALELLHEEMVLTDENPIDRTYTLDDVDATFSITR